MTRLDLGLTQPPF